MPLKIIGAGLGRTGTLSLKFALEKLGFVKCHHMMEVMEHPNHAQMFLDAALGKPKWDEIFDGFQAMVDWPGCHFWKELMDYYPDGKVILSLRDPESWYKSFTNTILNHVKNPPIPEEGPMAAWAPMIREIVEKQTFHGNLEDKDHIIATFNAHNERVKKTVPADRLLVFEAKDGWVPLCNFLGVPVPDEPYPRTNTTEEFQAMGDKTEEFKTLGEKTRKRLSSDPS